MTSKITVADAFLKELERLGVDTVFGIISIHNIPFYDSLQRHGGFRVVTARHEGAAVNMADAYSRVSGKLGVVFTSTGTGAGNAAGAIIESWNGGAPLLHITGNVASSFLETGRGYIHDCKDQLGMLKSISKGAHRVRHAEQAPVVFRRAIAEAMQPPPGPVSVEIPIDIQAAHIDGPASLEPAAIEPARPLERELDDLAQRLASAKRPLLWLGGGARHAVAAVRRFADLGFGVVTSVQGRGVIPEDHPLSLGAFNLHEPIERFYATCDAMLVVGSRLRSNETLTYKLKLPRPLYRIDVDPQQQGRCYTDDFFVVGDSALVLTGLADRLAGRMKLDAAFAQDLAAARDAARVLVTDGLGPYQQLVEELQRAARRSFVWVRDVTISNSTWGNRSLAIAGPRDGVHALGGGIGQGVQMALGAALAADGRKTFCLVGDGGLQVNIGELITLVQEKADVVILLMNDCGYGVIRNIQDAQYGGRRYYSDLHTPDFGALAAAIGLPHYRVPDLGAMRQVLPEAVAMRGPVMVEIDMQSIGGFTKQFAGPPVRKPAALEEDTHG